MPRGLNNWTYRDVKAFLKENGFEFHKELDGSHEAWIKTTKEGDFVVNVNFIKGGKSYPPLTLKTMIRQSGIFPKEWRDWVGK